MVKTRGRSNLDSNVYKFKEKKLKANMNQLLVENKLLFKKWMQNRHKLEKTIDKKTGIIADLTNELDLAVCLFFFKI